MLFSKTTCITLIASSALVGLSIGQTARPANLARRAAIPRLSDGRPNLNGIWQSIGGADVDLQDHVADAYAPGAQSVVLEHEIPYLPDALKLRQQNYEKRETADTQTAKCNLPG